MTARSRETILLTGGSGFIGRRALDLAPSEYEVISLGRTMAQSDDTRIRFVRADLRDPTSLSRVRQEIGPVKVIVHLGGHVPRGGTEEDWHGAFDVNVAGSLRLAEAFAGEGSLLIFASTAEVYGPGRKLPIAEDHPTEPYSFYGVSKLAAEKALQILGGRLGFDLCVLRFTTVFGPGEDFDRAIPNFIRAAAQGSEIVIRGNGTDLRDYLYIDDAARAVWLAVRRRTPGIFNIATGEGHPVGEVARIINNLSASPAKITFRPALRSKDDYVFDVRRARDRLGFSPRVTLEAGLAEQMKAFQKAVGNLGR